MKQHSRMLNNFVDLRVYFEEMATVHGMCCALGALLAILAKLILSLEGKIFIISSPKNGSRSSNITMDQTIGIAPERRDTMKGNNLNVLRIDHFSSNPLKRPVFAFAPISLLPTQREGNDIALRQ